MEVQHSRSGTQPAEAGAVPSYLKGTHFAFIHFFKRTFYQWKATLPLVWQVTCLGAISDCCCREKESEIENLTAAL